MKIQKITNNVNIQKTLAGKITKPAQKTVSKPIETVMGMGALSGLYLTLKAVQEKKAKDEQALKNLGFSTEFSNKILKNPVFNTKGIEILTDVSKLEDKTFYSQIIKNIDNITSLEKKGDTDFLTYKMSAQTPDGQINANCSPSVGMTNISIINGNTKTEISHFNTANEVKDNVNKIVDNKRVSNYSITYNKKTNVFTRTENGKVVKETSFSREGAIDDITTVNKNISTTKDFKNNQIITSQNSSDYTLVNTLTKTYKNPKTGKMETLKMERSDVYGVYNSTIIDEKGNEKIESLGRKNPDGSIYVEKNFESLDGAKTKYRYNKNGSNIKMFYQITDKDGKVLSTVDRTFSRISPELSNSSINGHKYGMRKSNDFVEVTDYLTGEKTNIKYADLCADKNSLNHKEIFDNMSGDMLLDFYKRGYKYCYDNNIQRFSEDSRTKIVTSNSTIFNFEHEHGHAKDIIFADNKEYAVIANNPLFKEAYEEERTAFINNCPQIEKEYIDYFINKISHYAGENGGLQETVAEINALFSTDPAGTDTLLSTRGYYLQKYFPKTIAVVSRLLNPNSNLFVKS